MGEIIKGNFGQKKNKPEIENIRELKGPNFSRNGVIEIDDFDVNNFDESYKKAIAEGRHIEVKLHLKVMQDFFDSLVLGRITKEVLATAEKQWQAMDFWEIVKATINSTSEDWQKYPGRYVSLVYEWQRRTSPDHPKNKTQQAEEEVVRETEEDQGF